MSYDREANQIVMQDSRVWIAGLGDEGAPRRMGAALMKELGQPDKDELAKIQAIRRRRSVGRPAIQGWSACLLGCARACSLSTDQMPADYYRGDSIGKAGRVEQAGI